MLVVVAPVNAALIRIKSSEDQAPPDVFVTPPIVPVLGLMTSLVMLKGFLLLEQ